MNFKGLIDFNKYTLATAAGFFVYAIEKFTPVGSTTEKWLLLILLGILLLSIITGIVIFATATGGMNAEASGQTTRINRAKRYLTITGTTHTILLCIATLLMGYMLYNKIIISKDITQSPICCCNKVCISEDDIE